MSDDTSKTPNSTIIFVGVALVAAIGIAGGIMLTVYDKDASAFYGFFTATLTSVVGFAALARSTGKINDSVNEVKSNVNGRMTQLMNLAYQKTDLTHDDRAKLNKISLDTGVTPTVESDTPLYDATLRNDNGSA